MPAMAALPAGPRAPAAWQLLRSTRTPLAFLEGCARRFGDPFSVRLAGFGPFVLLAEPAAVRDVFRGDGQALHSGEGNEWLATLFATRRLTRAPGALSRPVRRGITLAPSDGAVMTVATR